MDLLVSQYPEIKETKAQFRNSYTKTAYELCLKSLCKILVQSWNNNQNDSKKTLGIALKGKSLKIPGRFARNRRLVKDGSLDCEI